LIGLPLEIEAIGHARPGVVWIRGCTVTAADGSRGLSVPEFEIETTPTEVRLKIPRFECDADAARLLGGLAAEWLRREARFPRNCVVDVVDFSWHGTDAVKPVAAPASMHVECVSQDGGRAVRAVRRGSGDGDPADEARIVRSSASASDDRGPAVERIEVDVRCSEPVPVSILCALLEDAAQGQPALGPAARASGVLHATRDGGRWSGTAEGRLEQIALAASTAALQARAAGDASAVVRRLEWDRGRLTGCEVECAVGRGRVEQRFLDGLVSTVGCRAGSGYRTLSGDRDRSFDAAGCLLRIDARGVELLSAPGLGGSLAVADGMSLVDPPATVVPPERLAWLLAPPGAVYVPSAGPGSWLMNVMPRPAKPERPGGRPEF
jgi:hypothetical protein